VTIPLLPHVKEELERMEQLVIERGHLIDQEGIRPDPGKVAAIRGVQTPSLYQ